MAATRRRQLRRRGGAAEGGACDGQLRLGRRAGRLGRCRRGARHSREPLLLLAAVQRPDGGLHRAQLCAAALNVRAEVRLRHRMQPRCQRRTRPPLPR